MWAGLYSATHAPRDSLLKGDASPAPRGRAKCKTGPTGAWLGVGPAPSLTTRRWPPEGQRRGRMTQASAPRDPQTASTPSNCLAGTPPSPNYTLQGPLNSTPQDPPPDYTPGPPQTSADPAPRTPKPTLPPLGSPKLHFHPPPPPVCLHDNGAVPGPSPAQSHRWEGRGAERPNPEAPPPQPVPAHSFPCPLPAAKQRPPRSQSECRTEGSPAR